jgi:hypothetical protein
MNSQLKNSRSRLPQQIPLGTLLSNLGSYFFERSFYSKCRSLITPLDEYHPTRLVTGNHTLIYRRRGPKRREHCTNTGSIS